MSFKVLISFLGLSIFWSIPARAGIGFDGSLGYASATVANPDETKANYSGVSLAGRFVMPLIETGSFDLTFDLLGRYIDLNNVANSATQRETGNQIGVGAGLSIRLGKIYFGADYLQMRARHFFVGNKDEYLEFEYTRMSPFAGLKFQLGKSLSVAVTYSTGSGVIDSKYTSLASNSSITDTITNLHLTYETNQPFGKFFIDLFK